jgi:signal transduction histidine kinase
LRAQLALGTALIALLVVGSAGVIIAIGIRDQNLRQVDQDLKTQATKVSVDAGKLIASAQDQAKTETGIDASEAGLLVGSQAVVRVISSGAVVTQHGDTPAAAIPLPQGTGYSTIALGGQRWRSFVVPIAGSIDGQVQVLDNLAPVDQRLADNERVIAVVAVAATVLTSLGVWLIAGLVLAPLQTLRTAAARIRSGQDLHQRLPPVSRPLEVAELSNTLNNMLGRLQTSMLSIRRFTADTSHEVRTPLTSLGIDLENLRRNADLSHEQRATMLDAMAADHARIVNLFDGLQSLARGDAGALPELVEVDIAELVQDAVQRARRRHPTTTFQTNEELANVSTVEGWPEGLRTAIGNLLDNAALHGRTDGTVEVVITRPSHDTVTVAVSDDGDGIPANRRDEMKQRFARGTNTKGPGSGLGLALVDQQVRLHRGTLTLGESHLGGLLATVALPAHPSESRTGSVEQGAVDGGSA